MDRDIRLEAMQIEYLDRLARKRMSELKKKIEVAQDRKRSGDTIQHGTLDAHITERESLRLAREQFEGARKYFAHQIMSNLGMDSDG